MNETMLTRSDTKLLGIIASLREADMKELGATIRQIVREEIDAALARQDQRGLDNLLADISEPVDEQEEMAAVLATMTGEEWEALVQRVKERKATE